MIDLLVALSVIALVTAGVMLAASARAEVQRRLGAIGVRRAVGETRGLVTLAVAVEGLFVALPAATVGVAVGVLATYGSASRLLELLNEPPPGGALVLPLVGAWAVGRLRAGRRRRVAGVAGRRREGGGAAAGRRRRVAFCWVPAPPPPLVPAWSRWAPDSSARAACGSLRPR